jgi:dolichol-phosphate mannosyltransferase
MKDAVQYSIVIPVYNEEATLDQLYSRLRGVIDRLDGRAEVILVDDGSQDRSLAKMQAIHNRDPRFHIIRLSRNFGHQMALTAGCDYARGEATITMDADLQDPPEVIFAMIDKWKEGYELVYAVRRNRDVDSWFKKYSAIAFYHILRRLASVRAPINSADYRLVDRKVLHAFRRLREKNRYIRGLYSWLGFRQTEVYYDREARFAGETKYPFFKMLNLAFDAIVSFSNLPLKLCFSIGLSVAVISFLYGCWIILGKVFGFGSYISGWASLAVLMSFLGGLHMFLIGILGEYLSRIYDEVRGRPLYLVSDIMTKRDLAAEAAMAPPVAEPFRPDGGAVWAAAERAEVPSST